MRSEKSLLQIDGRTVGRLNSEYFIVPLLPMDKSEDKNDQCSEPRDNLQADESISKVMQW